MALSSFSLYKPFDRRQDDAIPNSADRLTEKFSQKVHAGLFGPREIIKSKVSHGMNLFGLFGWAFIKSNLKIKVERLEKGKI